MKTIEEQSEVPNTGFYFQKPHTYWLDGMKVPGVTTVLEVINPLSYDEDRKEWRTKSQALIQWAANEAVNYIEQASREHTTLFEELVYRTEGTPVEETFFHVKGKDLKAARTAHRKKKEDAADKGKDLHKLIEEYVLGLIEDNEGKADYTDGKSPIKGFQEWAVSENIRFLEAEKRLYSKDLWVAGTCDLVFEKDGKTYIGDIKTYKKLWDRVPMIQCAGYGLMWEEMQNAEFEGMSAYEFTRKRIDGYCVIRIKDNEFEVVWSNDPEGDKEAFLAALKLYKLMKK